MIKVKILTNDEAARVLATARLLGPQEAALAELAINSGLRLVEIADLDGGDVRLLGTDAKSAEQDSTNPTVRATVNIGFGKAPRVIPVVESVAQALAPFAVTCPANAPLLPDIATKRQAVKHWARLMQEAGVGMDSRVKKANLTPSAEAGRNRLMLHLLTQEEQGLLPIGCAGGYLGLPGTAYDDLPPGWQEEVVRAIRNGPTGAVGDLSAAGTSTD